jgi:hypothetical protein
MKTSFKFKLVQALQSYDFSHELEVAITSAEEEWLTVEEDLGLGAAALAYGKRDSTTRPGGEGDEKRSLHTQSKANSKRAKRRAQKAHPAGRQASNRTREETVQLADPLEADLGFSTADLRATRGAYSAQREDRNPNVRKKYSSLEEFMSNHPGFALVPWDGWQAVLFFAFGFPQTNGLQQ